MAVIVGISGVVKHLMVVDAIIIREAVVKQEIISLMLMEMETFHSMLKIAAIKDRLMVDIQAI